MIKKLSMFLALGIAVSVPAAFAAPILSLSIQEDALAPETVSSGTGTVSAPLGVYGDFILNSVVGAGTPAVTVPDLALSQFNVTSQSLVGTHTLTIKLTETGLSGVSNPVTLLNAFTGNLKGVSSETLSNYIDLSNTAYGMGSLLATSTYTTAGANSTNFSVSTPTNSAFSETEVLVATFSPTSTGDTLISTDNITANTVPEPASLALIGVGLLGFAVLRRRASKS